MSLLSFTEFIHVWGYFGYFDTCSAKWFCCGLFTILVYNGKSVVLPMIFSKFWGHRKAREPNSWPKFGSRPIVLKPPSYSDKVAHETQSNNDSGGHLSFIMKSQKMCSYVAWSKNIFKISETGYTKEIGDKSYDILFLVFLLFSCRMTCIESCKNPTQPYHSASWFWCVLYCVLFLHGKWKIIQRFFYFKY